MTKQLQFESLISLDYPGIKAILDSDSYTVEDVADYMRFCRNANDKSIDGWKAYKEVKDKVRRKGIASVMFNSNISDVWRGKVAVQVDRGEVEVPVIYVTVKNLGTFYVFKDGMVEDAGQ